jgi:hypothetical protein
MPKSEAHFRTVYLSNVPVESLPGVVDLPRGSTRVASRAEEGVLEWVCTTLDLQEAVEEGEPLDWWGLVQSVRLGSTRVAKGQPPHYDGTCRILLRSPGAAVLARQLLHLKTMSYVRKAHKTRRGEWRAAEVVERVIYAALVNGG